MLDINLIRENPENVKENLKKRYKDPKQVDVFLKKDKEWRERKQEIDNLRKKRNDLTLEITKRKKEKKNIKNLIKEARDIPEKIKKEEEILNNIEQEREEILLKIPNFMHKDVPKGKDASENKVIRKEGNPEKKKFEIKNHVELLEELNQVDFELGRKTSGQGFNYIKKDLALLDRALQNYAIDLLIKNNFELIIPPLLLNKETMAGSVNFTDFKETIYKIENEDLFLVGTAENALVALYKNKILSKKDLPKYITAVTPCFRKELGAHGVDQKGLFRMHQFNKVEQVCFSTEEESDTILEKMQKISEQLFKDLEIPHRVIAICSGDLGAKQAKQYDIEAWFPRQQEYKEVTSASNCTDYQARKLNIKYQEGNKKKYVHILNNTMVATSRAMVAIIENHQQKDGTIKIPKVLRPYMYSKEKIGI